MRIGIGFDIHKLAEKRELWLGCVKFDYPKGLLGHSDGDVVAHSIADAMLGACSLGDIGKHFPPGEESCKGIAGSEILKQVMAMIEKEGYKVVNIDANIICEEPKICPKRSQIISAVSNALSISESDISIKARTMEQLGPVGNGEAIAAQAVVLLEKI